RRLVGRPRCRLGRALGCGFALRVGPTLGLGLVGGHDVRRGSNLLAHIASSTTAAAIVMNRAMRLYTVERTRKDVSSIGLPPGATTWRSTRNRPVERTSTANVTSRDSPGPSSSCVLGTPWRCCDTSCTPTRSASWLPFVTVTGIVLPLFEVRV